MLSKGKRPHHRKKSKWQKCPVSKIVLLMERLNYIGPRPSDKPTEWENNLTSHHGSFSPVSCPIALFFARDKPP